MGDKLLCRRSQCALDGLWPRHEWIKYIVVAGEGREKDRDRERERRKETNIVVKCPAYR